MSRDHWKGNRCRDELFEAPQWKAVAKAIGKSDGRSRTLVTLQAGSGAYMAIGGGERDLYVVTVTLGDGTYHSVVNPSQPSGVAELVIGGQVGEYALRNCVDLHQALAAAKAFWDAGKLAETLEWEHDS